METVEAAVQRIGSEQKVRKAEARQGTAWPGKARRGPARQGKARGSGGECVQPTAPSKCEMLTTERQQWQYNQEEQVTIPTSVIQAASDEDELIFRKVQNLNGDCTRLSAEERTSYVFAVCRKLGLEKSTQPFSYIKTPDHRMILYANRSCGDQLRKMYNITLEIVSRDIVDDILTVHVRAKMPDGRSDEDLGAVPFGSNLRGLQRANAELTAVTKGKRRVTLSICGLGWLDESEVEDIPGAVKVTDAKATESNSKPPQVAPNVMVPPHDPQTGEITETQPTMSPAMSPEISRLADMARIAARNGTIDGFWPSITKEQYEQLRPIFTDLQALKNEYLESLKHPSQQEPPTEAADGSSPRRRARAATSQKAQPPEPPPQDVPADSQDSEDPSYLDLIEEDSLFTRPREGRPLK